jgi:hypothetical protein
MTKSEQFKIMKDALESIAFYEENAAIGEKYWNSQTIETCLVTLAGDVNLARVVLEKIKKSNNSSIKTKASVSLNLRQRPLRN